MKRLLVFAVLAATVIPTASASGPISTGVILASLDPLAASRIHESGSTFVRLNVPWATIAPATHPAGFVASDPADPRYQWGTLDGEVQAALQAGLTPYFTVYKAPLWAEKDEPHPTHLGPFTLESWKPDPQQAGQFAQALARRYSGSFASLPRVRYFEVWNEPNLGPYLSPQVENKQVVSPELYRNLLNAFADAVHGVHSDNVVIGGALSAFKVETPYGALGISPMLFMRRLLCMSAGAKPKPTCQAHVAMDAVSIHPWTSGGPTHHASEPGDVSLGDLPELRRLLKAAAQAGQITPRRVPPLWITEFAWDTRPPDSHADAAPIALESRWVAEALHQAWLNDVRVFTWLLLWDQPYPFGAIQSGLFFRNGENFADARPKPTFYAFRFPFVAYREGARVSVWGRTPFGRAGRVAVQQRTAKRWRWLGNFTAGADGVFSGTVRYHKELSPKPTPRPVSAAATYRDLVVSAHPASYWPLDESTGRTAADVTSANAGTYAGAVRLGLPGPFPRSKAADFNGHDARVNLGVVRDVHTAELWVKTRSRADAAAFSNRSSAHQFLDLGVQGGLAHSHDSYPITGAEIGDGQWHYLAYTYDTAAATGRLYVDGKLSQLAVWTRQEGGAAAYVGFDADLKSYLRGQVAQVALYPYVLSPDQIRSHYLASGRRIAPDVPVGSLRAIELDSRSASLPFSLVRPRDRYVLPFGGGGS